MQSLSLATLNPATLMPSFCTVFDNMSEPTLRKHNATEPSTEQVNEPTTTHEEPALKRTKVEPLDSQAGELQNAFMARTALLILLNRVKYWTIVSRRQQHHYNQTIQQQ